MARDRDLGVLGAGGNGVADAAAALVTVAHRRGGHALGAGAGGSQRLAQAAGRAPMSGRVLSSIGWAAVAVFAGSVIAWGAVGGLCMANDDLKFVRLPERDLPLPDALVHAWRTQPSFRPLEVLVAHASDPVTLSCPAVVPIQAAGLIALLAATLALVRCALPGIPAMWPVTLLLVLLSPATTASVWQMDSCSQTWSAALGAWSAWLAWRWIGSPREARRAWPALGGLVATVLVGLTIKENFYGWALGLSVASVATIAGMASRDRAAARRAAWVLVPVTLVPLAHLACRLSWSALPGLLRGGGDGSRYQAEFGSNLLVNAAASLAGSVGIGPFHLVLDGDALVVLRALPLLATGALIAVILLGMGNAALDSRAATGVRWPAVLFAASASLLSLAATIPMPAVSELYGLGANVGCALCAAAAAAALWRAADPSPHTLARAAVTAALALALAIGSLGLVSRAAHFGVVWATARALNEPIVAFQPTLPAMRPDETGAAGMVHVPTACLVGVTHSQYVMPPLQALDLNLTEEWLARRDPSRKVVFSIGTAPAKPRPIELVLDCAALPQHGHW